MKLTGEFEVPASAREVWAVFMDPQQLCRVLPGCEAARQIDATHYEASLATKVQFMTIRARAAVELIETEEPPEQIAGLSAARGHLVAELVGETLAMAGAFRARLALDLNEEEGRTQGRYAMEVTMLGRLGSLGEPIVRSTAQKQGDQFAANVSALFQETGRSGTSDA